MRVHVYTQTSAHAQHCAILHHETRAMQKSAPRSSANTCSVSAPNLSLSGLVPVMGQPRPAASSALHGRVHAAAPCRMQARMSRMWPFHPSFLPPPPTPPTPPPQSRKTGTSLFAISVARRSALHRLKPGSCGIFCLMSSYHGLRRRNRPSCVRVGARVGNKGLVNHSEG